MSVQVCSALHSPAAVVGVVLPELRQLVKIDKYNKRNFMCIHDMYMQLQHNIIMYYIILKWQYTYGETSDNGLSERRTISVQRTNSMPPIALPIEIVHLEPPRSGHLSTPDNG